MDVVLANMTKSIVGMIQMMALWIVGLLAGAQLQVRLYTGGTTIAPTTTLASLTEANFSGYAPITVSALSAAAVDNAGIVYTVSNLVQFRNNGGGVGNSITNACIVATIPGSTQATGTVTTTAGVISAPVITAAGSGYLTTPSVTIAGGGTGASITATVAGGVVTALTLVSGGTGYTTATIVIDSPLQIVGFYNFPSPRPMNIATDLLPEVQQLNIAA